MQGFQSLVACGLCVAVRATACQGTVPGHPELCSLQHQQDETYFEMGHVSAPQPGWEMQQQQQGVGTGKTLRFIPDYS